MRDYFSSLGHTLVCVVREFSVHGGLLASVFRQRDRLLLVEAFNAEWSGFVVYDGMHLYCDTARHVVPPGDVRAFFDAANGRDKVRVKNIYEVKKTALAARVSPS